MSRTYGRHKHPFISLFLLLITIRGPIFNMALRNIRIVRVLRPQQRDCSFALGVFFWSPPFGGGVEDSDQQQRLTKAMVDKLRCCQTTAVATDSRGAASAPSKQQYCCADREHVAPGASRLTTPLRRSSDTNHCTIPQSKRRDARAGRLTVLRRPYSYSLLLRGTIIE